MKTLTKTLFYKEYESIIDYGYEDSHKVKTFIKFALYFDFKDGLRFTVSCPNVSYCEKNPFKAFINMLERESIGHQKYNQMMDDSMELGLYRKMDVTYIRGSEV